MNNLTKLLEGITLIVWGVCVLLAVSGNIKLIVGLVSINAGLWLLILAVKIFKNK